MASARLSLLLAASLAPPLASALLLHPTLPSSPIAPLRLPSSSSTPAIEMVASKEIFSAYLEQSPSMQKTLTKVPPPMVDGGAAAAIAATAAAGFALTPSSRLAVNVVGGALGSTVGVFGRKKLVEERKKAALPAVAALLASGLQEVTPDKLSAIMKEYGVEKSEFQAGLGEVA